MRSAAAAAAAAAGGRSYYSSLSPIQQSRRPLATRGSRSSCVGYSPHPVDITFPSGNDEDDTSTSTPLAYENEVQVATVTAARHNILSFAFLTLVTLSAVIRFIPFTIISQRILYDLTNRQYFALPLAILNTSGIFSAYLLLRTTNSLAHLSTSFWPSKRAGNRSCRLLFVVMLCTEVSFLFHGIYVHNTFAAFRRNFFIEPDRTVAIEWRDLEKTFSYSAFWSAVLATLDLCVILLGLAMLWLGKQDNGGGFQLLPSIGPLTFFSGFSISDYSYHIMESRWLCNLYRRLVLLCLLASLPFLASAAYSAYIYLPTRNPPPGSNVGPHCDPVDNSECLMPFPSSFFTRRDNTTDTGRRVSISLEALSTMYKGGGPEHPSFLNELDGFSTGGPIVFYLDGLREGGGKGANGSKMPDPDQIEVSLTALSITLLLDIDMQVLTAHWSEFDQIDPHRPSVVMQPAKPLKHNTTYAVAVVNAVDMEGNVLAPSKGLVSLLNLNESAMPTEAHMRSTYYRDTVIPALNAAAPWLKSAGSEIQLLFDFHTASATSQLGVVRTVRDKTMQQLKSSTWGNWSDHIRVIRTVNGRCRRPSHRVARLVHAEVDVPWYLTIDSPRHRASFIDQRALYGDQTPVEPVKFVVLVPCSLVGKGENSTNLTSVIDFGHSFLYSRQQLIDSSFLHKMANDNGYVMVATNWRGMSRLDLPVILRTFLAEPNLFQSARDNLIQGYAAKMTIQQFCRDALLNMDFMKFSPPHVFQINNFTEPRYMFFGASQGGILGGAYSALVPTGLLDATVLGNPGTPFGLLMPRSDIFPKYLSLLLLNLHYRRHVRIVLSLMQMALDSIEVSGVLASPLTEPSPKALIFTGLGDSTVTTLGAEIFARAYGARTFANGPRTPYGLDVLYGISTTNAKQQEALFTELLYEKNLLELYSNTTKHGGIPELLVKHNDVHVCTRLDPALEKQTQEFILRDTFIDACFSDGCIRSNATC